MKIRGLSVNTVHTRLRSIRAWFHWMIDWELIEKDPCARIKSPRLLKVRKPFVTDEQLGALLDLCPINTFLGARRQAMISLMVSTGIRRGELVELMLEDLDWDGQMIRVLHGKGQKERFIHFPRECQRIMLRYVHQRRSDEPWLWVSESGKRLHYHGVGQDMKRLGQRAGVELHDICHIYRRSFAAQSVRNSYPSAYIRGSAGWTSDQMLERYTGWMEEEAGRIEAYRNFRPYPNVKFG